MPTSAHTVQNEENTSDCSCKVKWGKDKRWLVAPATGEQHRSEGSEQEESEAGSREQRQGGKGPGICKAWAPQQTLVTCGLPRDPLREADPALFSIQIKC